MKNGYQPLPTGEFSPTNPPSGRSGVVKSCEHKYIYLEKRRIKEIFCNQYITKLADVFYCEKCLDYKYKEF